MKGFPDLPPIWLAGHIAVIVTLTTRYPIVDFDRPSTDFLGSILVIAGFALVIWSAIWFRRKQTSIEPHETPSTLIVEGPFRINRNPIYTGMVAILTGVALQMGSLLAVLSVPLFPIMITQRFILREEAALKEQFGAEADAYFARSRRW